jgi:hypothetical protein
LANSVPHAALLRGPDTTRENVVDAPIVALKIENEDRCLHPAAQSRVNQEMTGSTFVVF